MERPTIIWTGVDLTLRVAFFYDDDPGIWRLPRRFLRVVIRLVASGLNRLFGHEVRLREQRTLWSKSYEFNLVGVGKCGPWCTELRTFNLVISL